MADKAEIPWIVRILEDFFYSHGKRVARRPWLVIPVCLAICGLLSIGLLNFDTEASPYKLWIPQEADFVVNTNWLWENFPSDTRYHSVIVTADNVLTPEVLQYIFLIHQKVHQVKTEAKTWKSSCYKIPVVDLRGERVPITEEENNLLHFDSELNFDTGDYSGNYDYYSTDNDNSSVLISRKKRSSSDPSVELYPTDYCKIVEDVTRPTCFETSIAELWAMEDSFDDLDDSHIQSLTPQSILDTINTEKSSKIFLFDKDFISYLGGIERNESGHVVGAKATLVQFFGLTNLSAVTQEDIKASTFGAATDKDTLDFEKHLLRALLELPTSDQVRVFINVASSFTDLSNEAVFTDVVGLIIGVGIVYFYALVMIGGFGCVEQKPMLGGCGLLCVGLSIACSYGVSSAIGLVFSPMHGIIPFLLLGIGIDDMFVIVQCLNNIQQSQNWEKMPVEEIVGQTMKHAGVAITITSFTDLVVFGIGAISLLPALKSFCLYCAFGVGFVYLLQSSLFVACLTYDIKRVKAKRNGFFPCFKHAKDCDSDQDNNFDQEAAAAAGAKKLLPWWRVNPGSVFFRKYAEILVRPASKSLVMVSTLLLTCASIYGLTQLRQEFVPAKFLPSGSYLTHWLKASETFFPQNGVKVKVNIADFNHTTELDKLGNLSRILKEQRDIVSSVDSWLDHFTDYVNDNNLTMLDQDFPYRLTQYLHSPSGAKYRKNFHFASNLVCGENSPSIKLTSIEFTHQLFIGSKEHVPAMQRIQDLVQAMNFSSFAFAIGDEYAAWETDKIISWETYQNLVLSSICVFLVTGALLVKWQACLLVFACVVLTLIDVAGFMFYWDLTIDVISCVNLVIAVGLCVDYSAHVAHSFMVTDGSDNNEKTIKTLADIGPAVMNGGFSTFLAFIVVSGSESHVFITFFKIFFMVVVFGLYHGLVFLPVALSLVGTNSACCSRKICCSAKVEPETGVVATASVET